MVVVHPHYFDISCVDGKCERLKKTSILKVACALKRPEGKGGAFFAATFQPQACIIHSFFLEVDFVLCIECKCPSSMVHARVNNMRADFQSKKKTIVSFLHCKCNSKPLS